MEPEPPTPANWLARQLALRPAVFVAVAFIAGVAAHATVPRHPGFWCLFAALSVCGAIAWAHRPGGASTFIMLAAAATGLAVAQAHAFRFPRDHIAHFASDRPRLAQLQLYLDHEPRVLGDPFSIGRALPPRQVCVARVAAVKTWNGWEPASGSILVQIDRPHPRLAIHQTVRVLGMLQRPSAGMNPGQFDWYRYYRNDRVLCSIGIDDARNIDILAEGAKSPLTMLRESSRRLLGRGFADAASLDHALLRALLLGDHDPELRDVQEQFRRTGTSHHLAISGMHVAVLGGVLHGLCRLARLSPRASAWISLAFVIVYGLAALPSPPVVRSMLLCSAFTIGVLGRRTLDPLQLLAVSVIAMLAYHPQDLFNAGFQLSFGTVLGLILFTPPVMRWMLRDDPDTAVVRSFNRLSARQRLLDLTKRSAGTVLAGSAVAWVVSAPLIALHFEQLNPYAIPGSIVLAPIVFFALVGGMAKIILTLLFPAGAEMWAGLATLPMEAMRDVVEMLSRLPGADVPLPAPRVWMVVLFYAALVLPLAPCATALARRTIKVMCTSAGAILLGAPVVLGFRAADLVAPRPDELSFTLLAVGAGQCAVIAPPRGPLVVVDAGSISLRDPLRRAIAPFVRHIGRWSIGRVILSHGDYDHISAAAEICRVYGVNEVLTGPEFARHAATNPPADGLLRFLEQTDRTVLELLPGNRVHLGGGASIDVLWPPRDSTLSSNDSGLVIRLSYGGRAVLFPADIQDQAMRQLLQRPGELKADVLVAPHHGSCERMTAAFVSAVDPLIILSSNDRTLSMKQFDFEDAIGGRTLYRTHRDGSITVRITRSGRLAVQTYLQRREQ